VWKITEKTFEVSSVLMQ